MPVANDSILIMICALLGLVAWLNAGWWGLLQASIFYGFLSVGIYVDHMPGMTGHGGIGLFGLLGFAASFLITRGLIWLIDAKRKAVSVGRERLRKGT